MVKQFEGGTADDLWKQAATSFLSKNSDHLVQMSRNGLSFEYLHCCLHLKDPRQRWILSRKPAINPAFAIAEFLWILQGRNDAAFVNYWNPDLPKFSGNGDIYHGAYGERLRRNFGLDQIERAYEALNTEPDSRQVVLQIWDSPKDIPNSDGTSRSPDIPCNVTSMLKVRSGKLEWTQIMRSNDLYRGTPHNFIQFTSLQEVIAGWLGLELGSFILFADSLHLYEGDFSGGMQVENTVVAERNNDSLMLSKVEFDRIFPLVMKNMDRLRADTLLPKELISLTGVNDFPISWQNLLCISAADSARRRNWSDEMIEIASLCKNPTLSMAWKNWLVRKSLVK